MTEQRKGFDVTRRQALAATAVAAGAGLAAVASASGGESKSAGGASRLPVAFFPHGGGPWPFVETPFGTKAELDALASYLRSISSLPKTPPKALLVISAHWEERVPTVMTSAQPPMLYDYGGFPREAYEITWPAPGDPKLAARVQELLVAAGFATAADPKRGFDHGTFVPLKLAFESASVPCVQLSLRHGLDPAEHLRIGRALAPLRDEGVLIVGSGMSYHNMRGFGRSGSLGESQAFDAWLRESVALPAAERDARLTRWTDAPAARACHPREEHLLPLMVVAGAGGEDRGRVPYNEQLMGVQVSAVQFG
jgi:aromatic ring-opening dioxygenase catalytic subunit (LigB family)